MFTIHQERFYKLDKKRPGTYIKVVGYKRGKFVRSVKKRIKIKPMIKLSNIEITFNESYSSPAINFLNQWAKLITDDRPVNP